MDLGIRVFGMTRLQIWRCVCALFGILMVPVSYAFIAESPEYMDCLICSTVDSL